MRFERPPEYRTSNSHFALGATRETIGPNHATGRSRDVMSGPALGLPSEPKISDEPAVSLGTAKLRLGCQRLGNHFA